MQLIIRRSWVRPPPGPWERTWKWAHHCRSGRGRLGSGRSQKPPRTNRSRNEILIVLHGVISVPAGPTSLNDGWLRIRYHAALNRPELRLRRFHDPRHTFGTLAITRADILGVQSWMGDADVKTTMGYLHDRDRSDAARRVAGASEASVHRSRAAHSPVKVLEVLRLLEGDGWTLARTRGSHWQQKHPTGSTSTRRDRASHGRGQASGYLAPQDPR